MDGNVNVTGHKLRVMRVEARVKQLSVARHVGISQQLLSMIEHEWRMPSPELAERIAVTIEKMTRERRSDS
jgi:DNA-binding XRE family transcriptional regulator